MSVIQKGSASYYSCNQAKDGEFRLACDAYGGEEKYMQTL